MNIRRGMNRLFIVAWVVYGVWLAWYVFQAPDDNFRSLALLEDQRCEHQFWISRTGALPDNCADKYTQMMAEFRQDRREQMSHPSWIGLVLLMLIVPPPAVYGIVLILVKVASWVVAGLRISKPANPI
jgi:hypothetical protein